MDNDPQRTSSMARRASSRRAMSFLELAIVVAILGLLALAAITRFGHSTIGNGAAEGFTRKLAIALMHARRSTISTGDNHYLLLTTSGSNVVSYALMRRTSSGDVQVDETRQVPRDVTVTSSSNTLEFDFEGAALAAYSITVAGPDRSWNVSVGILTGSVVVTETT